MRLAMFCASSYEPAVNVWSGFGADANEDAVFELSHDGLVAVGAQLLQIALRRIRVVERKLAIEVVALLDRHVEF